MKMRKRILGAVFVFGYCLMFSSLNAQGNYNPNQIIVKYNKHANKTDAEKTKEKIKAKTKKKFKLIDVEVWELTDSMSVDSALTAIKGDPNVIYAEPDYIVHVIDNVPNDPSFNLLWGMHNTGQSGGTNDADIDAPAAWDMETGGNVKIGVIDTGVDYNHPDLAANIWTNPGEIAGNGIDDDGNGFIDDVHGWDFVNNDNDPMDDHFHGTHCAGTIAGVGNNGKGVAGVCWNAQIIPIKFLSAGGSGSTSNAIASVEYATTIGVHLTSNSWGGGGYSQALYDAIEAANSAGQLFVAAAGNDYVDNDTYPHYPSSYTNGNIIAVAATDHNDNKAGFSNWGATSVDLAAPGVDIYSCNLGNSYRYASGTSMACPHVAGGAALVWSYVPSLPHHQVKNIIMNSAESISSMAGMTVTGARLNIYNALVVAQPDTTPPSPVIDLAVVDSSSNFIRLGWTASGDDSLAGKAASYDIRYSSSPINSGNFSSATPVSDPPIPQTSGTYETYSVDSLSVSSKYYFAIKVIDEQNNNSTISNTVSAQTLRAPDISISPSSLSESLLTGETSTQTLTISNDSLQSGLTWSAAVYEAGAMSVAATSPSFRDPNNRTFGNKSNVSSPSIPQSYDIFKQNNPSNMQATLGYIASLESVLDSLTVNIDDISGVIPNRYDFSDGVSGTYISDGGNDMYDGGNYLSTNLGSYLNYSNYSINTNLILGSGGRYFTAKGTGVFVLAADVNNINHFDISGNLGADGSGSVDGAILQTTIRGEPYYGFVKRVFSAGDPSVNHLFIIPADAVVDHEFSTNTNDDYHRLLNISSVTRLYYLLYAGSSGYYIDNSATLNIMNVFLNSIHSIPRWLSVSPENGNISGGGSANVNAHFNASHLSGGDYDLNIIFTSNDPDEQQVIVPAQLHVTGAPDLSASRDTMDYDSLFIGVSRSEELQLSNIGTDTLQISNITIDNSDFTLDTVVTSYVLPPYGNLDLSVTFAPSSDEMISGTLSILSNDQDTPSYDILLKGKGLIPPEISVSPDTLSESLLTGDISTQTFTISNTGGSNLDFDIGRNVSAATIRKLQDLAEKANEGIQHVSQTSQSGETETVLNDPGKFEAQVQTYENYVETIETLPSIAVIGYYSTNMFSAVLASTRLTSQFTFTDLGNDYTYSIIQPYDGVIISERDYNITSTEANALESFYNSGKGIVCGMDDFDDLSASVQSIIYPIFGISSAYDAVFSFGSLNPLNPITQGITSLNPYDDSDNDYFILNTADWIYKGPQDYVFGASNDGTAKTVIMGERLHRIWMESSNNQMLIENAIEWAMNSGWLSVSPDAGTIGAGGNESITVTFDATGMNGGGYDGQIIISSNDPDESKTNVGVHLQVTGAPDITVQPDTLDFGQTFVGFSKSLDSLIISNDGTDVLSVTSITSGLTEFSFDSTSFNINPSDSRIVEVIFAPSSAGVVSSTVTISSNDHDEPSITMVLLGEGLIPPDISISPDTLNESLLTGETSTQTLTISNTGGSDLSFDINLVNTNLTAKANTKSYKIEQTSKNISSLFIVNQSVGNGNPAEHPEGSSVTFKGQTVSLPFSDGFEDGNFNGWISDHGTGTRVVTNTTAACGNYSFHYQYTGSQSDHYHGIHQEFPVGSQPEHVSFYVRSGSVSSNDAYFVLLSSNAQYDVIFFYAKATGYFYVNANVGGHESYAYNPNQWYHIEYKDIDWSAKNFDYYVDGVLIKENISFRYSTSVNDITALYLYNYDPNSKGWWDQIQIGSVPWLTATPLSGIIPAQSSSDISIGFDASGLYGGDYTANITIQNNDPDESSFIVPTTLQVTGVPDITILKDTLDYGAVFVHGAGNDTLVVSNNGTDVLHVTGVVSSEAVFVPDSTTFSLNPGESQQVVVTFAPTQAISFNGTLTISSNDHDEPTLQVVLQGTGITPPKMVISPDSLSADLFVNQKTTQLLTISNQGGADLDYAISVEEVGGVSLLSNNKTFRFYQLPSQNVTVTSDGEQTLQAPINKTVKGVDLFALDLTGVRIGYDSYHCSFYTNNSILMSDLVTRGASVGQITSVISYSLLNNYDVLWLDDNRSTSFSSQEINDIETWIQNGGSLFIQSDEPSSAATLYMRFGIQHTGSSGISGSTSNIFSHPTTDGITQVYLPGPFSQLSFSSPVVAIVNDAGNNKHACAVEVGQGRVVCVSDEVVFDNYLSIDDNRAYGNRVFDWLASGSSTGWITLTPETGVVPPSASYYITALFDATGLDGGAYDANIIIQSNDPLNASVSISAHLDVISGLSVSLSAGWNFISWNVDTPNDATGVVLGEIMSEIDIALGFEQGGTAYDPSLPNAINTLTCVDHHHGYEVYAQRDTTIFISGSTVNPQSPIYLEENWNLVSYLPSFSDSTHHAIESVIDQTIVVLGYDGGGLTFDPTVPPVVNTLNVMHPGQGYWIKTSAADTLTYPTTGILQTSGLAKLAAGNIISEETGSVIPTKEWISVWGQNIEIDEIPIQVGTIVKAVDKDGVVCGFCTVQYEGIFGMMAIYRDDAKTEIDEGALPGEDVTLYIGDYEVPKAIVWTSFGAVVNFEQIVTALGGALKSLPDQFALYQNYPNPFNPTTTIKYDLPAFSEVELRIFNILGAEVMRMTDIPQEAGFHSVQWDAKAEDGSHVPSGIYFYSIYSNEYKMTRKMILLK